VPAYSAIILHNNLCISLSMKPVLWIWIRADLGGLDPDPHCVCGFDPGGQKLIQKRTKWRNFIFRRAGYSLLRAGDLWSLTVLHGVSWEMYCNFLSQKLGILSTFTIFGHQISGLGFGTGSESALTLNAWSGSTLEPMQIHNTKLNYYGASTFSWKKTADIFFIPVLTL
jgi:hypothetical protein